MPHAHPHSLCSLLLALFSLPSHTPASPSAMRCDAVRCGAMRCDVLCLVFIPLPSIVIAPTPPSYSLLPNSSSMLPPASVVWLMKTNVLPEGTTTHDANILPEATPSVLSQVLSGGVQVLSGGVQVLSGGVQVLSGGVQVLSGGVQVLSGGVQVLSGGVRVLSGGVQVLSGGVQVLSGGVQVLSGGVQVLSGGVQVLSGGVQVSNHLWFKCPVAFQALVPRFLTIRVASTLAVPHHVLTLYVMLHPPTHPFHPSTSPSIPSAHPRFLTPKVAFQALIPCFLMTKVASTLAVQPLTSLAALPLLAVIQVCCTPLHSSLLHSSPLLFTPLLSTPLHSTPLYSNPLYSCPIHSSSLLCSPPLSTPLVSISLLSTPLHSTSILCGAAPGKLACTIAYRRPSSLSSLISAILCGAALGKLACTIAYRRPSSLSSLPSPPAARHIAFSVAQSLGLSPSAAALLSGLPPPKREGAVEGKVGGGKAAPGRGVLSSPGMVGAAERAAGRKEAVVMSACAFGNSLTLPLVFLATLLTRADADRAAGYLALFMLVPHLLESGLQHAHTTSPLLPTDPLTGGGAAAATPCPTPLPPHSSCWSPTFWTLGYSMFTGGDNKQEEGERAGEDMFTHHRCFSPSFPSFSPSFPSFSPSFPSFSPSFPSFSPSFPSFSPPPSSSWSPTFWTLGYGMFTGGDNKQEEGERAGEEASAAAAAAAEAAVMGVTGFERAVSRVMAVVQKVLNPPIYGVLAGLLIGATPLSHFFLPASSSSAAAAASLPASASPWLFSPATAGILHGIMEVSFGVGGVGKACGMRCPHWQVLWLFNPATAGILHGLMEVSDGRRRGMWHVDEPLSVLPLLAWLFNPATAGILHGLMEVSDGRRRGMWHVDEPLSVLPLLSMALQPCHCWHPARHHGGGGGRRGKARHAGWRHASYGIEAAAILGSACVAVQAVVLASSLASSIPSRISLSWPKPSSSPSSTPSPSPSSSSPSHPSSPTSAATAASVSAAIEQLLPPAANTQVTSLATIPTPGSTPSSLVLFNPNQLPALSGLGMREIRVESRSSVTLPGVGAAAAGGIGGGGGGGGGNGSMELQATGRSASSASPSSSAALPSLLDDRALWVVCAVRLLLLPMLGTIGIMALYNARLIPQDPICALTLMIQTAMPSAQNLVLMSQLSPATKPLAGMLASLMLRQYAISMLPITVWITVFLLQPTCCSTPPSPHASLSPATPPLRPLQYAISMLPITVWITVFLSRLNMAI
ncbi:unnamed protein product [Closterium sp. NIES-65]|nr:unnamed protein product [Closterium sp. NIES-65]CAI6002958.1 unnamed protein product [Closterium sp. NIES-65]